MRRFIGRVRVMPRTGLLDPQGHAVQSALGALGFNTVRGVRIGKTLEIALDCESERDARDRLCEMCERLLANPVTEDYAIDTVEAAP